MTTVFDELMVSEERRYKKRRVLLVQRGPNKGRSWRRIYGEQYGEPNQWGRW